MREFACECGDPACEETVALPIGVLWVGPVLASGHVVSISRGLVRRIGDGPD